MVGILEFAGSKVIFGENEQIKTYNDLLKVLYKSLPKVKFAYIPVKINSINSTDDNGKWIWWERYMECKHLITVWNIGDNDAPTKDWKKLGCQIDQFRFAEHRLQYSHFIHPYPTYCSSDLYFDILDEVIHKDTHERLLRAIAMIICRKEILLKGKIKC